MTTTAYPSLVSISRLGGDDTREQQNQRAIDWLLRQPGGSLVVVTPQKRLGSASVSRFAARVDVDHLSWRGFFASSLAGKRVLHAWPDRAHIDDLWGCGADAVAVIEWNEDETAEWIEDASPIVLSSTGAEVVAETDTHDEAPLPNGVDGILEHVAGMAAGYSSGLKWNEEDKLKADMMNRPERWMPVSVDQVRSKCRALGMRPRDVDTVAGFLQRRKEGRRFNVRSSYRDFQFN
ncbi:hypothetical protein ACWGRS_18030 [Cellulosimicrobium funkei]